MAEAGSGRFQPCLTIFGLRSIIQDQKGVHKAPEEPHVLPLLACAMEETVWAWGTGGGGQGSLKGEAPSPPLFSTES